MDVWYHLVKNVLITYVQFPDLPNAEQNKGTNHHLWYDITHFLIFENYCFGQELRNRSLKFENTEKKCDYQKCDYNFKDLKYTDCFLTKKKKKKKNLFFYFKNWNWLGEYYFRPIWKKYYFLNHKGTVSHNVINRTLAFLQ